MSLRRTICLGTLSPLRPMPVDFPRLRTPLELPTDHPPVLLVVVDTEEEFDWGHPFDRANTSVEAMRHIGRAQELCDEFGIRPTYVIDQPVATREIGWRPLREYVESGRAVVGAHLHPWVSAPHEEEVSAYNSYPGNLPRDLEKKKIWRLTDTIEHHIGVRPTIYKAGRYGFGPNTADILEELEYQVDLSACPGFDLGSDGGPDWSAFSPGAYRFGENRELVGYPTTGGFVGWLWKRAPGLYNHSHQAPFSWFRAPGILSRTGALERLLLSPEGYTLDHLKRLSHAILARGTRILSFSFHSPSLAPGHTPYVRSESELQDFLATCRQYFEFFLGELGGASMGPLELRELLIDPPTSLYPTL